MVQFPVNNIFLASYWDFNHWPCSIKPYLQTWLFLATATLAKTNTLKQMLMWLSRLHQTPFLPSSPLVTSPPSSPPSPLRLQTTCLPYSWGRWMTNENEGKISLFFIALLSHIDHLFTWNNFSESFQCYQLSLSPLFSSSLSLNSLFI